MPILTVIIVIVAAGVILWAINKYVPMAPNIKQLLNVAVIIILILWLLSLFGIFDALKSVTVGK